MTRPLPRLLGLAALLLAGGAWAAKVEMYSFPEYSDYAATVLGTPAPLQAEMPAYDGLPRKDYRITVFPGREVPEVFWYDRELQFSLLAQQGKAPLVFAIAGTGGSANGGKMRILQRALYGAGFHVISLPSPTHANFLTAASSTRHVGNPEDDARDLYTVMQLAYAKVAERVEVDGFALVGYSLGGLQTPFVLRVDDEQKQFNFRRALMINPPVSLFDSVGKLDAIFDRSGLGDPARYIAFRDEVFEALSDVYRGSDTISFSGQDFLYQVYREKGPSDETLAKLVALTFRISAGNLVFVTDVLNKSNYIVPAAYRLTSTTRLTDYAKVAFNTSFVRYFDDLYAPYYRQRKPGVSDRDLVDAASLKAIESTLRNDARLGMLHNADDIIMLPGQVDYLAGLLGDRATIYPFGGHCGNMDHRDNVAAMVKWLRGG
ncbi:MAG TPA: alpha/beta hydrolase [Gammaproteobacteria bacterium]